MKKLELVGGKSYSGNAADKFVEAKLFDFESLGGHFEEPKGERQAVGIEGAGPRSRGAQPVQ